MHAGVASMSTVSPHPALPPPGGKGHRCRAPVACRTVLVLTSLWNMHVEHGRIPRSVGIGRPASTPALALTSKG
jgi:hypothetical protein